VRLLLAPLLRIGFGLGIAGRQHVPEGAAIIAANHKSFLDPFFIALGTKRQLRCMAKAELFRGPVGRLVARLGAFPVRRGEADAEALQTARAILAQGGLVLVFPEGTCVTEPDVLGAPHHGAGTLALDTGAPIVPTAITGTSIHWLGPVPLPGRVRVAFAPPVAVADLAAAEEPLLELIDRQVWPAVQREYGRLRAAPGVLAALLAAIGIGSLIGRSRSKQSTAPRVLGVVAPRKERRRKARRRLLERLVPQRRR
jgi:1-acyl-sn-glycerol-3-phosphate acyltransferase